AFLGLGLDPGPHLTTAHAKEGRLDPELLLPALVHGLGGFHAVVDADGVSCARRRAGQQGAEAQTRPEGGEPSATSHDASPYGHAAGRRPTELDRDRAGRIPDRSPPVVAQTGPPRR